MFKGIEGSRAWLAWIVVLSHIVILSGIPSLLKKAAYISKAGHYAVGLFIIISGFVIANLLITRKEDYLTYICRRGIRIFPVYLICLLLGVFSTATTYPDLAALGAMDGAQINHLNAQMFEAHQNFWQHLFLHLTMLHGIIPNNVLDESQYMFLATAWSLSLEWQFYLVAPFALSAIRGKCATIFIAITLAAFYAYQHGNIGHFYNPSILFGAAPLFLLGMSTRLVIEKLPNFTDFPWPAALGFVAMPMFNDSFAPITMWIALVFYMRSSSKAMMLDGKLAIAAGERSYAVYAVHYPIVLFSIWACRSMDFWPRFASSAFIALAATAICAECLHRWIELPTIRFGKSLRGTSRPA